LDFFAFGEDMRGVVSDLDEGAVEADDPGIGVEVFDDFDCDDITDAAF
jgi:hypothetical protein